jgi:hypothetical protein
MLWLAIILFIAWLLGFVVFHVAGGPIHLPLVVALVVFVFNLITGFKNGLTGTALQVREGFDAQPGVGPSWRLHHRRPSTRWRQRRAHNVLPCLGRNAPPQLRPTYDGPP